MLSIIQNFFIRIQRINDEYNAEISKIEAEADAEIARIKAEGRAEIARIKADHDREMLKIKSMPKPKLDPEAAKAIQKSKELTKKFEELLAKRSR